MTMMVQTSTDDAPGLLALIEQRRAHGLDRYDEWWEGVYRIVTGPSIEHQQVMMGLATHLSELVAGSGLSSLPGVNIGRDNDDAKVPDIAVFRRDTPRTSHAFLATAELVVEIMSPGERRGEKLPFYARWGVAEYLELDPAKRSVRLLAHRAGEWVATDHSDVVDLTVAEVVALLESQLDEFEQS